MTYEFDRLISDHLEGEKLALWGSVAKNVGSFAYNAARSAVPFLGKSTGAGVAGTLGYNAGAIKDAVKSVPGSFHVTSQQPAYKPQNTLKLAASPREMDPNSLGARFERYLDGPSIGAGALKGMAYGMLPGALIGAPTGAAAAHLYDPDNGGVAGLVDSFDALIDNGFRRPYSNAQQDMGIGALLGANIGLYAGGALGAGIGAAHAAYKQHKAKQEAASPSELVPFKHAFDTALKKVASDWHRPVNIASYEAFALPYLFPSIHDNQKLTTALNTAGLLGLGATSAHSLAQGDPMSLYDLGGLGLMGAGVLHSALRPQPHHQ